MKKIVAIFLLVSSFGFAFALRESSESEGLRDSEEAAAPNSANDKLKAAAIGYAGCIGSPYVPAMQTSAGLRGSSGYWNHRAGWDGP